MRWRTPAEGSSFHKAGTNAIGGHTAEADDPCGRHVISIQSCPVMATSKTPEIPTDITAPVPKRELCCAWPKVGQFPTSWVLLGKAGTRPRPQDPHPCR